MLARLTFVALAYWLLSAVAFSALTALGPDLIELPGANLKRYEFSEPQMGVAFRIVLYVESENTAKAAARAAFHRVKELNEILSDYEYDSELNRLSRSSDEAKEVSLSSELWFVLEKAQALAKRTDGAFDVTAGPIVSLWRKARRLKKLPDASDLAEARKRVGFRNLELNADRRSARLKVPGMRLDLGAIAKGYAADEALKALQKHGIRRALAGADGDIVVGDPSPGRNGWRIGLAQFDNGDSGAVREVLINRAAISTSGDLSQRLEIDGRRYSHIVDPRTGIGLMDHSVVTVIAPDGITADSLATAISVLGPEKGLKLITETPGSAARIVRQPGAKVEVHTSPNFKDFLIEP